MAKIRMSKPLKLYTDVHIPKQVALQLRNRGVDVLRCQDVNMDDASDAEHLEYATLDGRALVSIDRDFHGHHWLSLVENKFHSGIFSVSPDSEGKPSIGRIVTALFDYWQLIESGAGTVEDDIENHIFYIK